MMTGPKLISVSVAILGMSLSAHAYVLTLFHVNDTHARIEPARVSGQEYGGMARLATVVKEQRAKQPNFLFVHAGDTFQGTLYYNVHKGMADVELWNQMGLDAMALGNHEFDDGPAGLLKFAEKAKFKLLSANLQFSTGSALDRLVAPWKSIQVGGDKLALIGAMTEDLPSISSPGPNVKSIDLDMALTSAIREAEEAGLNKIILLSHCGYERDQQIAKDHPEIDIIVGGHSHSFLGWTGKPGFPLPLGLYPKRIGGTLIVQSWEWAKVAGLLKVEFDEKGRLRKVLSGGPIPIDSSITPDPQIQALVDEFKKPVDALQLKVIGTSKDFLARDGNESPMGSVIADAQLLATQGQKTQLALMNLGGVRAALDEGQFTYGDLISVQPFNNTLVVLDLTGDEIVKTLQIAANAKRYIQVSNLLSYTVQAGKVLDVKLNGELLQASKTYRVVVNSFMANGGDGYTPLKEAKGYRYDTGFIDVDALIAYVEAKGELVAPTKGRVTIIP